VQDRQYPSADQRGLAAARSAEQQEQTLPRAALEPHALQRLKQCRGLGIAPDEDPGVGHLKRNEPGVRLAARIDVEDVGQSDLKPGEGIRLVASEVELLRVSKQTASVDIVDPRKNQTLALLPCLDGFREASAGLEPSAGDQCQNDLTLAELGVELLFPQVAGPQASVAVEIEEKAAVLPRLEPTLKL
jgi:hypothetical protein